MSIYKRDDILPEWEPAPWLMETDAANEQERGFHLRAQMPIKWQAIPWHSFPGSGVIGHDKDWLSSVDAAFYATTNDEDLLLIDNTWSGWPDPPRWGLASRPCGQHQAAWVRWGHFADLPSAWDVPTSST